MATTTGPIITLPGHQHNPEGAMCDNHPDRPAVTRIQGETDSFGCEMYDFCEDCKKQYIEEIKNADQSGWCDWCKKEAPKLSATRCCRRKKRPSCRQPAVMTKGHRAQSITFAVHVEMKKING